MQAIEFQTSIKNSLIEIPRQALKHLSNYVTSQDAPPNIRLQLTTFCDGQSVG